jgi:hypothetical protein
VCTLERLSFLHVSLHESLGLGFASEIKSSAGSRGAQHPVAAAANACHDASMATGWGRRLLIATGGAAASEDELPPLVRALIETASELLVMTPMLVGRLQWLASDSDRARYEADERLSTVLGHVETIAPEAAIEGRIGDDTPFTTSCRITSWSPSVEAITPAGRNEAYSTRSGSSASRSRCSSSTGRDGRQSGRSETWGRGWIRSSRVRPTSTSS